MNEALRDELLAMRAQDEAVRARLEGAGETLVEAAPELRAVRDRNADRLAAIVGEQEGWPKRSVVGRDGAEAAWLVAMHALGHKEQMLAWAWDLVMAAQQGEASPEHAATLTDRTRALRGKEQIYGCEVEWDDQGRLSPLPITQPDTVDVRRESVGLEPLAAWIADVRARAAAEGDVPSAERSTRRERYHAFLRHTGWRK